MPEQSSTSVRPLQGEDLIAAILHNMEQSQFRTRYSTLVPYLYRAFLHPSDYALLRGITPQLVAETKRALDDQIAEWNRSGRAQRLLQKWGVGAKETREYKKLAADWVVEFHADLDERLQPGDIEVYSEMGEAKTPEFGVGTETRRITRAKPAASVTPIAPPVAAGPDPREDTGATTRVTAPAAEAVYAYLRYDDTGGHHEFPIKQNTVVIGRGGRAYWVDLKVETLPDVSREHCRLRRDPDTGKFYLKDVSQFGTTVDGVRLPGSVEVTAQGERDKNVEVPLPTKARIGLADVLFLEFEAVP